ncbi:MAG: tRNA lysidine(34) synthetase TilS [Gemmatimonadales bacterium]
MAPIRALPHGRYLLAVSGGRDSMVLLDAFAGCRADIVAVGTFDHATGPAAERAARLVEEEGRLRSVRVVSGRRPAGGPAREAAWRGARWKFLSSRAKELTATVVTAHTRDDQLETVAMRVLRDPRHTSVRGLAAMYAPSPVARPLLTVGRSDVAAYAAAHQIRYVDDPSNVDRAYLRNRVRLDLLPALETACPGFGAELIGIARRAAEWRESVERVVDTLGTQLLPPLVVPLDPLRALPVEALGVLWPAIAGRAGIVLDWRGTERLVAFTTTGKTGGRIPLSGGAGVERTASTFVLRASGAEDAVYL